MQYPDALDYLYSRLPVFHRIGAKAIKPGLGNTLALCEALGNPHLNFQSIHVAGTNGKGSTSHMLAAVYGSAGYRVGLYTSPHLKSFTERIRLNGQPIAEDEVAQFVTTNQSLIESIEPSFFEVTVAMAFDYFARQAVDVAIIEVGLGGRLDSTNVITPLASVITNISYDHTDVLGDTLSQIAAEKAGIIKAGIPVIVSETQPETAAVFQQTAQSLQAPVTWADQVYTSWDEGVQHGRRHVQLGRKDGSPQPFALDLSGGYQLRNAVAVLATVEVLQSVLPVTLGQEQRGLADVTALTGLQGRFQTLREQPRVIADTAHNQAGLLALFETISSLTYDTLRIIIGMVADKDRTQALAALPESAVYYFCQAQTPRSLPARQLQLEASQTGRLGEVYPGVNEALTAAWQEALPTDLILITGSNYTIAELTIL